jgi:protein ImuB
VDGAVQEIAVGAGIATRDAAHLGRLLDGRLERLEPGFGFDRIALCAEVTEPLGAVQASIERRAAEEALAQLIDRLSQRLRVWRLAPRLSHWPEREVAVAPAFEVVTVPEGWPARPRPVRLLHRPVEVQAMALLPDAPPSLLRIGRTAQRVIHAEGPERLACEWWREERPARDYYRLEMASGARLWVCRIGFGAEARWFVHGYL